MIAYLQSGIGATKHSNNLPHIAAKPHCATIGP